MAQQRAALHCTSSRTPPRAARDDVKFTTAYSTYEVDPAAKRIRRIEGVADPQPRQGEDGEWKTYQQLSAIAVGHSVTIIWAVDDTDDGPVARATETSPVTAVYN